MILNDAGQALVFERPRSGRSGVQWRLLNQQLNQQEEPFTAVQNALLQNTGYQTTHWSYLGSHAIDPHQPQGTVYFFCAQKAQPVADPQPSNGRWPGVARWVPLSDVRYALLDGRISIISHALTVSLAFLTTLK